MREIVAGSPMDRQLDRLDRQLALTAVKRMEAGTTVPPVRGFVRSEFNPLIYHAGRAAYEQAELATSGIPPERRGVLLGSLFGDAVTEQESWRDLLAGRKISPIMFPQSVPSAIVGYLARDLDIRGPMSCIGTASMGAYSMLLQAADWLFEDDADAVLLLFCDVPSHRAVHWAKLHAEEGGFVGGAVAAIAERKSGARERGAADAMTVRQFHDRMAGSSVNRYGMAGIPEGGNRE